MKKFIFVLFEILGFVLKTILLFALVIIGIDLIGRGFEDKKAPKGTTVE